MKYNPVLISYFFKRESTKYNVRQLLKFLLVLAAMVAVYSILCPLDRGRVQETHPA